MDSVELGKRSTTFMKRYKELFGYLPRRLDFACNNREFFDALVTSVEQEVEITKFLKIRELKPGQPTNI